MDIDLKSEYRALYTARTTPEIIDVPELLYLMLDGTAAPDSEEFQRAIGVVYAVAYGIRSALQPEVFYPVMPLQARWGSDDIARVDHASWQWSLMILQPYVVTVDAFDVAVAKLRKTNLEWLADLVRLEALFEGRSAQIMHIGPYADEKATIQRLLQYVDANGYVPVGRHHEIYLSDPNRTAPKRLRTIIRYPIRSEGG